jgi:hypothetical protein
MKTKRFFVVPPMAGLLRMTAKGESRGSRAEIAECGFETGIGHGAWSME